MHVDASSIVYKIGLKRIKSSMISYLACKWIEKSNILLDIFFCN